MNNPNLMEDAVTHAERAHREYGQMQKAVEQAEADRDTLRRDNDLLRAEVARAKQRCEFVETDSKERIDLAVADKEMFQRYAVKMATELSVIQNIFGTLSNQINHCSEIAAQSLLVKEPDKQIVDHSGDANGGLASVAKALETTENFVKEMATSLAASEEQPANPPFSNAARKVVTRR